MCFIFRFYKHSLQQWCCQQHRADQVCTLWTSLDCAVVTNGLIPQIARKVYVLYKWQNIDRARSTWSAVNYHAWMLFRAYSEEVQWPRNMPCVSVCFTICVTLFLHDDVIKWKLPRYWPFVAGHRWIPLTKASDAELWYFLCFAPEQTVE